MVVYSLKRLLYCIPREYTVFPGNILYSPRAALVASGAARSCRADVRPVPLTVPHTRRAVPAMVPAELTAAVCVYGFSLYRLLLSIERHTVGPRGTVAVPAHPEFRRRDGAPAPAAARATHSPLQPPPSSPARPCAAPPGCARCTVCFLLQGRTLQQSGNAHAYPHARVRGLRIRVRACPPPPRRNPCRSNRGQRHHHRQRLHRRHPCHPPGHQSRPG